MRNIKRTLLITLSILFFQIGFGYAQSATSSEIGIFDVLNFQEVLEVELEMDINSVISNRRNPDKHPAIFSFTDELGNNQKWNIKVNLRGKFRRSRCAEMPPLKLNFKKADLKSKGLSKYDDLKLVTHCIEDEEKARKLILKEYLAYKLYNQISEESFRVQLLKINYVDNQSLESKQHWAMLIEDTAQMRNRIGAEKAATSINVKTNAFEKESLKKVALFQYMIGNLDWDIHAARNLKIVKKEERMIAIPYDFDFSFFVDAPYTVVGPEFKITSKHERVYLGFEKDLKNMEGVKAYFNSKKKLLFRTIKNFKLLKGSERRKLLFYLDTFFDNIDEIRPMPKAKLVENIGQ